MPLRILLFYALPALPLAALTLPLYIIVPTFYSETIGLSLASVGTALLAVRVVDALVDPATGWLADRFRPAFGRRRVFFLMALPITAGATLMLFWPPQGAGAGYLAIWGTVMSLGYTACLLSYQAWGAEIAGGYRERSRVAAFREGFTIAGTLVAIALPFAVGFGDGLHGLAVLGMVVAAGLVLSGIAATAVVPEPREYSVSRLSFRQSLGHMARNGPFVRLILAFLINGLANGIPATLFLYFVSSVLGAPDMRGPMLFLYFLAGLAGVPAAAWAASRLGKHRAWAIAMIFNCVVFSAVSLLGTGDILAFAAICVVTGICLGFDLALPTAIQADVIDVDTAASGEQRSGLYFAAWSLATKLSLALGVGIVFPLLGLAGFDPAPGAANSDTALRALSLIYVVLPIALKVVAIALMWNFPLDETEQSRLRATIEARAAR